MVQARVLRKNNQDAHYANAIFSFLRERATKHAESTSFCSADAKCKVNIGDPGFPIASVSRGKQVIVGHNKIMKVGDHDFSKMSIIPDAILIHDIPGCNHEEYESSCVGALYRGQVYYGIKDMLFEGSTA